MARDKNNKEMMQIRSFCETSTTSEGAIQSFSHGEIDFIDKRRLIYRTTYGINVQRSINKRLPKYEKFIDFPLKRLQRVG